MTKPLAGIWAHAPRRAGAASTVIAALFLGPMTILSANPTGGAIVAGAATIGAAGKTLTINQSSNIAIINWQTFSIASGETTKFFVPTNSSATLNRVLSGNPSEIYGTLSSNGQLFLLNPSGIVVGPGGRIDTSSFLGSTLDVSNSEFLNGGDMHFTGSSTAGIDNRGSISATGGNVFLIANQVSNEGSLTAPEGDVGVAAASSVLLQQAGDQHLFVQSNPVGTTRAVGVSNAGTIGAASAELRAAGGNAYALAINNTGSVAATGYRKINGQVYLTAGTGAISNSGTIRANGARTGGTVNLASQSGTVTNSGQINVSATGRGGQGGSVTLTSLQGAVANTGAIEAKGGTGGTGGTVNLSGASADAASGVVDVNAKDGHAGTFTIEPTTLALDSKGDAETTLGSSTDTITGTAFTDSGNTASPGVTITFLFDGTVVGTTQANGSGVFTFNLSSTDVGSGLLLTDATDKGATFFQSGSSSTSFSGIDIWGSTLRVFADTASNSALKTALGALTGHGINYSVSGSNLSTSAGINLDIVSNYTIDGNLTAAGTFTAEFDANLTGSTNATLQGTSVSISSFLADTGALTVHSTSGEILLEGVGDSDLPASVDGLTLNSSGAVNIQSCYINLPSGNFAANGTGYTSTTDGNGEANGVNIFDTTISAQGGNITLNGAAGYTATEGGVSSGLGVAIGSDGELETSLTTTGSGNITITGTCNKNINSQTYMAGVDVYDDSDSEGTYTTIYVANGNLSISGTVDQNEVSGSSIDGVFLGQGSDVEALNAGSVSITGNSAASTTVVNGNASNYNAGADLQGILGVNSGNLTIHGIAGTVNTTNSTITDQDQESVPSSVGVTIDSVNGAPGNGQSLFSDNGSTVSITGTGGAIVTTGAFTGKSGGVDFSTGSEADFGISSEGDVALPSHASLVPAVNGVTGSAVTISGIGGAVNAGNGANSGDANSAGVHVKGVISVEDGSTLAITGTGGALNTSNATPSTTNNFPITAGVSIEGGGTVNGFGSAPITITGKGGNVTAGSNLVAGAIGVEIGAGDNSETVSSVTTEAGLLQIDGTGGSSPSLGTGVVLNGFNSGSADVTSTTGNITLTGTGGSGYAGTGTITGNYIPNAGVTIVDNVSLTTGGNVTITGTGGANSNGVTLNELTTDTTLDSSPTIPTVQGDSIRITSLLGRVFVNADVNANTLLTITSPGALVLDNTSEGGGVITSALSVTADGPISINESVSTFGAALIESIDGNITLGPNATISDDGGEGENPYLLTIAAGNSLAHSHYLINDSTAGATAISAINGATFDIYSADPTNDVFNGVTVPTENKVFDVTFPSNSAPEGDGELFYVANASATGPNSPGGGNSGGGGSTTPTNPVGVASTDNGSGSNIVPPSAVPQNGNNNGNGQPPPNDAAGIWGGSINPPFSFTGSASSNPSGPGGGLASTSGNGGLVGAGDAAQLNGGGLNNVQNPAAEGALDLALGPAVHNVLNQALTSLGNWTDTDYSPGDNGQNGNGGNGETLLNDGDVVVIGENSVTNIPLSQAPAPLQKALGNGVLNGLPGH